MRRDNVIIRVIQIADQFDFRNESIETGRIGEELFLQLLHRDDPFKAAIELELAPESPPSPMSPTLR